VLRVRKLLQHLDELEMKKVKKGSALSGYFLMRLFSWCDINDDRQHGVLAAAPSGACTGGLSPCALLGFTDDAETDTRQTNKLADAATEFFRST